MRISDWSSDVCSSDLGERVDGHRAQRFDIGQPVRDRDPRAFAQSHTGVVIRVDGATGLTDSDAHPRLDEQRRIVLPRAELVERSEEHTSELQSLMRSSYAVFCLKKTKEITQPL